jgi:undecaprenyl-diphosphatase
MSRKTASEYTFFLAVPVMLGASLLKLLKFGLLFTGYEIVLLAAGMIVAFFVSIFAIKFLLKYIRTHDFKVFGVYRIVLGIIVLLYFAVTTVFA